MGKFNKKLIALGSIGIVIAGGLGYNILNKPNNFQVDQNKKEMIAMYIQDEEGNYQTSSAKEFPKEGYVLNIEKSTCKNGGILSQDTTTKAINLKVSHADACNLYFDKDVPKIEIGDITIPIQDGNPNFATPATTDETVNGLFSMADDYGTSYYYRGAVENNYVKFGKVENLIHQIIIITYIKEAHTGHFLLLLRMLLVLGYLMRVTYLKEA